jgi:hypothetical protein
MIDPSAPGDNDDARLVHSFHMRETCVFHSVHRFTVTFWKLAGGLASLR